MVQLCLLEVWSRVIAQQGGQLAATAHGALFSFGQASRKALMLGNFASLPAALLSCTRPTFLFNPVVQIILFPALHNGKRAGECDE